MQLSVLVENRFAHIVWSYYIAKCFKNMWPDWLLEIVANVLNI